jgi:hypothetical protein
VQGEDVGDVARLAIAHLDAQRGHQHESGQAIGALHRHLRGDPAAERGTDQDHLAQVARAERGEPIEEGRLRIAALLAVEPEHGLPASPPGPPSGAHRSR